MHVTRNGGAQEALVPVVLLQMALQTILVNFPNSRLPKSTSFECGTDLSSGFITSGQDAKRGQFPFAALLGYEDLKGRAPNGIIYLCGGSLINRFVELNRSNRPKRVNILEIESSLRAKILNLASNLKEPKRIPEKRGQSVSPIFK